MSNLFIEYPKCSTCKKAKTWLENNNIDFEDRHIVECIPTKEELKKWKEANKKYSNIKFDLILDENNEFILTYNSGASRNQEVWLESVSFPGV